MCPEYIYYINYTDSEELLCVALPKLGGSWCAIGRFVYKKFFGQLINPCKNFDY